ncbi:hypothetical protein [Pedobacter caeni]|uniref:Uncharacterized protein n=1 Tax=Pedobacter caeni TaxID=288992 RepID=A0A1M5Q072_9SPHI|nr:hypothetical protein [Pedobacter caeni]SHH07302.1 hypothetical protein SAMN04488522_1127 [Pedobacter caeni]
MSNGKIIEIAGTTITECVKGDYELYGDNIFSTAGKEVHEEGKENGKTHGDPKGPPVVDAEPIEAKCIVQFRPNAGYNGEYGFDWVRFGDTGVKGDTWYRDIIGEMAIDKSGNPVFVNQVSKYDLLLRSFKNMVIPWKGKVKGNPYLYTQAVMTLWEGSTAKLSLKVEMVEKPEKLIIRQRKKSAEEPDYFTFNVTDVTIKDGKYNLTDFLEISCTQSFDTDQFIDVMAVVGETEVLAGCLTILKNGKAHRKSVKILFVNITTAEGSVKLTGEEARIKKYLKQAYVDATVVYAKMDLTKDKAYNDEMDNGEANFNTDLRFHERLYEKFKKQKIGKKVIGKTYDNYYHIFFTKKILGNKDGYLLGEVDDIGGDHAIILDVRGVSKTTGTPLNSIISTAAHEFFHLMGLSHTFLNKSKFVFKKFHTDNVMDYSDIVTKDIPGIYTFKWQWSIVQSTIAAKKKARKGK